MLKVIKLGRPAASFNGPGAVAVESVKSDLPDTIYPSLYLEWDKKYDLPESGTMTIKFHKKSETTKNPKDGKGRQQVELDVLELSDIEADDCAADEEDENPGDALDTAAKEVSAEKAASGDGEENY